MLQIIQKNNKFKKTELFMKPTKVLLPLPRLPPYINRKITQNLHRINIFNKNTTQNTWYLKAKQFQGKKMKTIPNKKLFQNSLHFAITTKRTHHYKNKLTKNIIKKISKLNLKIMKIRKLREKKGVREKIY